MRLLVDCHVFDGKFQGTRTYLEGLYRSMIHYKDISYYFAAQDIENLKSVFGEGENISYVKLRHRGSVARLALDFPKIIKKNKIDYAHFQYIVPFFKNCKFIDTIHDVLFLDYPQYFSKTYKVKNGILFKHSAQRSDVILTVSRYSKKRISKWFGIPESDIYITENAVLPADADMELPDVKNKYGLKRFVLTVGRIEPRKNYLILLEAFVEQQLYKKGYDLVIVGTPDLKYTAFSEYYFQLSEDVKKHVKIMSVPFKDLVALYKAASLFVFPSLAEGFGIPPLEAINYDCPILCSNSTAMLEFGLPDEVLFCPTDKEELKRKMKTLLNSPLLVNKTAIEQKFNWRQSAFVLHDLLTDDAMVKNDFLQLLGGVSLLALILSNNVGNFSQSPIKRL